ncbi:helix-turn-helix domain-containing protein [Alkalicoccobacillus porphyridii]|uniref:Helix-turn-helix transcriptional regulator n=1 Tax=Alkalicoccobacillus porphyridii TaxID=2597270 RepID=A0A553ZZ19_9BACI|nr:helix-turn-helix transcriptional regulator [Alkalicoccobacillus porphyridii]TSB46691.1 helix-turn-helix transcriptional regulator [Alkalicoccobacillus porphyridii]
MSLVKKARQELGYSLELAATKIGISAGYLSQIETGKRQISSERALLIANVYNVQLEDIFTATRYGRKETSNVLDTQKTGGD